MHFRLWFVKTLPTFLAVRKKPVTAGFELAKQNRFAKISQRSHEKDPQAKNILNLQMIL